MPSPEASPPLEYKPPTGLRAKLPTSVNNYFGRAETQGLKVWPGEEQGIIANPQSHEIIRNNGASTFLVHGTDPATAEKIAEHGLALNADFYKPNAPDLFETTKMLAATGEKAADARNIHSLAYRYEDDRDFGRNSRAKVVAELAVSNPGTSLQLNQFEGTALEQADGVNIVAHGEEETAHGKPFSIPPERIRGYFDVETGEFVPNARFVAVAEMAGHAATQQGAQPPEAGRS